MGWLSRCGRRSSSACVGECVGVCVEGWDGGYGCGFGDGCGGSGGFVVVGVDRVVNGVEA